MTMDVVARSCGISKRTLYEEFPDKRTLIEVCLDAEATERDRECQRIFEESEDSFVAMFRIFTIFRTHLRSTSRAYYDDLRRLYPDAMKRHNHNEKEASHMLANVLRRAQQEGLVAENANPDIAAFLFMTLISSLNNQPERMAAYGFTEQSVADELFLGFLRSSATLKGISKINALARQTGRYAVSV